MIESTYNLYLFYRFRSLEIMKMQTNNILILAPKNFAGTKKEAIKLPKIIIKNREYFIFIQYLNCNSAQMKLNSDSILLTIKSHMGSICLVIDYNINLICSKEVTKEKLLFKN